jgi:hypothetical protein
LLLASVAGALEVSWHLEERIRLTSMGNAALADPAYDRGFLRVRTRVGGEALVGRRFKVGARLTNEFRDYWEPDDFDFDWDEQNELVVENLYASYAGPTWDIVLGKRGYHLGRGMIVMEGGPLDGSRTVHLHGLWLSRKRFFGKQTLMYLFAPKEEMYPEPLWDDGRVMVEGDEWAVAWLREWTRGHTLYLYKEADARTGRPWTGLHVLDIGMRHEGGWCLLQLEAALQLGTRGEESILAYSGWGCCSKGTASDRFACEGGYILMSGDDPETRTHEGWDPVFARWPMLSELYIYTLAGEQGVAWWSNLHGPYVRVRFGTGPLSLSGRAHSWWSFHGTGHHRGEDVQLWLTWRLTRNVKGHLLAEYLWPGDFHQSSDPAHFLRAEINLVF